MVNKNNVEGKFQVKPLDSFEKIRNGYKIKSYNIKSLDEKPVDYFVFASHEKPEVYVFKKIDGKYTVLDDKTIQFEYDPIQF